MKARSRMNVTKSPKRTCRANGRCGLVGWASIAGLRVGRERVEASELSEHILLCRSPAMTQ